MVKDFHGWSLSTRSSTMIVPNPSVPEMTELQNWFDDTHGNSSIPISVVDCDFTSIRDISTKPNDMSINGIGVGVCVDEPEEVMSKDGRLLKKRAVLSTEYDGY